MFGTFFVACNDDDKLPTKIEDAFRAKYPNATNVYHKRDKHYYYFVFEQTDPKLFKNYTQYEAYFDRPSGSWLMTDTDIKKSDLPTAVLDSFNTTKYATGGWTIRNIFWVSQPKAPTEAYMIRVVYNNTVAALLYDPEGKLEKEQATTYYYYIYPWLYNWGYGGWGWWY